MRKAGEHIHITNFPGSHAAFRILQDNPTNRPTSSRRCLPQTVRWDLLSLYSSAQGKPRLLWAVGPLLLTSPWPCNKRNKDKLCKFLTPSLLPKYFKLEPHRLCEGLFFVCLFSFMCSQGQGFLSMPIAFFSYFLFFFF